MISRSDDLVLAEEGGCVTSVKRYGQLFSQLVNQESPTGKRLIQKWKRDDKAPALSASSYYPVWVLSATIDREIEMKRGVPLIAWSLCVTGGVSICAFIVGVILSSYYLSFNLLMPISRHYNKAANRNFTITASVTGGVDLLLLISMPLQMLAIYMLYSSIHREELEILQAMRVNVSDLLALQRKMTSSLYTQAVSGLYQQIDSQRLLEDAPLSPMRGPGS